MDHPTDRMAHTTAFVTPVVEHWLERETCCLGNTAAPRMPGTRRRKSIYKHTVKKRHFGLGAKEGNVLFNDALNMFYLRLYGERYIVKDHSDSERGNLLPPHGLLFPIRKLRKEMFYLTTHSTCFIYGYMASDIW